MDNSTYFEMFSDNECITWLTVMTMESIAIVTLNVVTIIIFVKTRGLRRHAMYLVINLAVADMFVGGISEVTFLYSMGDKCSYWKDDVDGIWNNVLDCMELLFVLASLTNIVAISLERMHATCFPLRHRVIRKRIYVVTIAILWILTAVASGFVSINDYYYKDYLYYSLTCFGLLTICVSYASIAVKIYYGSHPQHHGAASRERKLTVTLFIVTLVSLLTWLPWIIWRFITYNTVIDDTKAKDTVENTLTVLYFANSLVNPILYAIRMPDFKRALVSLFLCRAHQRQVVLPLRVM